MLGVVLSVDQELFQQVLPEHTRSSQVPLTVESSSWMVFHSTFRQASRRKLRRRAGAMGRVLLVDVVREFLPPCQPAASLRHSSDASGATGWRGKHRTVALAPKHLGPGLLSVEGQKSPAPAPNQTLQQLRLLATCSYAGLLSLSALPQLAATSEGQAARTRRCPPMAGVTFGASGSSCKDQRKGSKHSLSKRHNSHRRHP